MSLESSAIYADSKFTKAQELSKAGKIDESIEIYEEVVEAKPDHIQSLTQLIRLQMSQKNWQKVVTFCKQAIRFKPENFYAHKCLANAFTQLDRPYKAIATYQELIELGVRSPAKISKIYRNLGDLLFKQKDSDRAILAYKKAREFNSEWDWRFYLKYGNALLQKKKLTQAFDCYQKVIQLNPDFIIAYLNAGSILSEKQQFNNAIKYYQRAIQINPDSDIAYKSLGDILVKQNKLNSAVSYYLKVLQLNPNAFYIYGILGDIFAKQGKQAQAEECYKKIHQTR